MDNVRNELKENILAIVEIENRSDVWYWCYRVGYDCNSSDLNEDMARLNDDQLKKFMIETLVDNIELKETK